MKILVDKIPEYGYCPFCDCYDRCRLSLIVSKSIEHIDSYGNPIGDKCSCVLVGDDKYECEYLKEIE